MCVCVCVCVCLYGWAEKHINLKVQMMISYLLTNGSKHSIASERYV